MTFVYTIKWKQFQKLVNSYSGGMLKVVEKPSRYVLYLDTEKETYTCAVLKNADDPSRDFAFVDTYLSKPNVIKVIKATPSSKHKEDDTEAEKAFEDDEILEMLKAPTMTEAKIEDIPLEMPKGVTREEAKK